MRRRRPGLIFFNTEVDYGFDPLYESIYPQHYHAALTVRSGGSRSIHSIYTGAEGGTHEGIRSDVYKNTDRPFAAYVVATTPDSYRTSMQVFSVDGNGLVYGLSGFTQASDGRLKQDVKEIVSGMDRISALRGVSFRYKPGEEQPVSAVANENSHAGYASSDIKETDRGGECQGTHRVHCAGGGDRGAGSGTNFAGRDEDRHVYRFDTFTGGRYEGDASDYRKTGGTDCRTGRVVIG